MSLARSPYHADITAIGWKPGDPHITLWAEAADGGSVLQSPALVSLSSKIGSSSIEHIRCQWLYAVNLRRGRDTTNQGTIGSKCAIEVCQHHPLANLALIGMIANKFIVKAGNIDWKYHVGFTCIQRFCPRIPTSSLEVPTM